MFSVPRMQTSVLHGSNMCDNPFWLTMTFADLDPTLVLSL